MNYDSFREFILLAESRNYAEVADDLFISESTLGRHIRLMEKELGVPLFDRTARGIMLNEYGKLMLPYARKAVELWEICRKRLDEEEQRDANQISVLQGYNISRELLRFRSENEQVVLRIMNAYNNYEDILMQLKDGKADFVVTDLGDEIPDWVNVLPLREYIYFAICSGNHRLAAKDAVTVEEICGELLVDTYKKETETDGVLQRVFREQGMFPQVVKRVEVLSQLLHAVQTEELIGIRRDQTADLKNYNVKILSFSPVLRVPVYVCYQKGKPLRSIDKRFIEFVRKISTLQ